MFIVDGMVLTPFLADIPGFGSIIEHIGMDYFVTYNHRTWNLLEIDMIFILSEQDL